LKKTGNGELTRSIVLWIRRLDLGSEKDMIIYEGLIKEKLGTDPEGVLEDDRESYLLGGQKDLGAYTEKHFNQLVEEELPEQIHFDLGYLHCPGGKIKGEENKEYEGVRKVVVSARDVVKRIKENRQGYIAERIKGKALWMKEYLLRYPDKIIKRALDGAQKNAEIAIRAYGGATKFLKDTKEKTHLQMVKLEEKISELEKVIQVKLEPVENRKKGELSAMEKARLIPEEHAELLKLSREYKDARDVYTGLIQNVQFYALKAIEEKQNSQNPQSPRQ